MSLFDRMLNAMKLDDDDDEDDEDYEVADTDPSKKEKRGFFFRKNDDYDDDEEDDVPETRKRERVGKVTDIRSRRNSQSAGAASMEVCVIKPTSFEEVREIAETLLASRTVILNMEGLDLSIAQRIIDFMSGATYAVDGNLQKVSNFIFIITPRSVDISGDLLGIMDSFEFSGINIS